MTDNTENHETENSENPALKVPGAGSSSFNPVQVVKRLAAAEGYLEIGLPAYALRELNTIRDSGPFEPILQLFRGEALQAQERFSDAIAPLNRAAELFPAPLNQRALMALSNCYRHSGQERLADEAAAAAMPESLVPGAVQHPSVVSPIFQIATRPAKRFSDN
ncbi:tetratricopeptide repeat protein [Candidatus Woesearchaeota archaeon]|nr:tetratricopeptide repeat protein [Candidatus Woesearchaeota archaeon]MBM4074279.1 tetratricopeptide repeat protein [Planctomycetota bacterium]